MRSSLPESIVNLAVCVLIPLGGWCMPGRMHAQSLEPRAYSNAPAGLNFLLLGYQNSRGALVLDPALPVTEARSDVDIGLIGYVRTLDIGGNSAKAGLLLPYASLSANGYLAGTFRTRDADGLADPSFFFSYNFYGAPALSPAAFRDYRQDTIIGFTLRLTAPMGRYESDKIINLGTNRWTIEPGLGVSRAAGNWILEAAASASVYGDNNDFDNGKRRQQDPIYAAQFHVTYNFPNRIWGAVSTTYYTGGRTTLDGVTGNDLQQNWRTGFTLALPLDHRQSVKLYGSRGVSTRTGTNFDILGLAWQYRWGGGI